MCNCVNVQRRCPLNSLTQPQEGGYSHATIAALTLTSCLFCDTGFTGVSYSSTYRVLRCCPACGESCGPPWLWEPAPEWPESESTVSQYPPWLYHCPIIFSIITSSDVTWELIRSKSTWSHLTRPGEPRTLSTASIRQSAPVCCGSCTGSSP